MAAHPTEASDTAAAPPPPPAPEPAENASHTPPHTVAPTAATDTDAPPPPPPLAPEPAAKVSFARPPTPTLPQPDALAPKKRKLEEGFYASAYYKIRATVADLRLRFLRVYQAPDFRNSDAAGEILKEMNIVVELSKRMRLDLGAASEPVKPSEKPLAGAVKDAPTEPTPSVERNQVPQTGQTAISPNNANDGAASNADKSGSAAEKILAGGQISEMEDDPK